MAKQPEKIDKYGEVSLIARGGMGAVYKAMHPTLNRPIILKKLTLRGKSAFAERFRREARILMDFRHDDIVTVFDHFKQGSSYYIVMEFVEGNSLEGLIKEQRYLDSVIAAYIVLHVAKALGYAHRRGVVHRDIKPANLLISRTGAIKLADFGIAASADDVDSGLTSEGMTLGTPSYMAPEQFENSKNVDARADIYALGVMAYEMSTGKRPFSGGFSPELITAKQKGRYPRPARIVPGIARPLRRIIRKTMRSSRKRRIDTVDPIIKEANRILRSYNRVEVRDRLAALVRGDKDLKPLQPRRRGGKMLAASLLGGAAAILLGLGIYLSTALHPLFLTDTHGKFRLELRIPDVAVQESLKPEGVKIFLDDGKEIPLLLEPLLVRIPNFADDEGIRYTSRPFFLPARGYRLKIILPGEVYWQSFTLSSYRKQKLQETPGTHLIQLQAPESQPLSLRWDLRDALTGAALTEGTELQVETPNGLETYPFAEPGRSLATGRVWRFHISHPGYERQIFSLFLSPKETLLNLRAELLPIPATLRIVAGEEAPSVTVNGSETVDLYYRSNPDTNDSFTIAPFNLKELSTIEGGRLKLAPGSYRIESSIKDEQARVDLNLESGRETTIYISAADGVPIIERR